jgi:tripartite-type tricarboxylate transporter receptor subunit TctC
MQTNRSSRHALAALCLALLPAWAAAQTWEPTAPVQFVVPAGTGGGADQMARLIRELVIKHQLMKQPLEVVNRAGNSGAEGLLAMKAAKGDPHRIVISLSNLFTTPLATGSDFNWRDLTPVQLMALDQFVLWVRADHPARTAKDLLDQLRSAPRGSVKLGGTGSRQEDQILSVLLETAAQTRITYVPLRGGGDVAKALVAGEVDLTVNNPIEAEALWREGKLRPLCVFDWRPLQAGSKVTATQGWADVPICMAFGIPVQYQMMRGVFMAPGVTPAQQAYYNRLLDRVRALPEWQAFMAQGAFRTEVLTGPPFVAWLDRAERFHRTVMREAKLLNQAGGAAAR